MSTFNADLGNLMSNQINNHWGHSLMLLLVPLVCLSIHWLIREKIQYRLAEDTESYALVAETFSSEAAQDRPPLYPLFLKLSGRPPGRYKNVVIMQVLLVSTVSFLLYRLARSASLTPIASGLVALLVTCSPAMVYYANHVLPETIMAVLISFLFYSTVRFDTRRLRAAWWNACLIGILSGLCALVKPVWVLGFVVLGLTIALSQDTVRVKKIGLFAAVGLGRWMIVGLWATFLWFSFSYFGVSRVGTVNLNLIAIRAGFTEDASGTQLYNVLHETGLLGDALRCRWDKFTLFTKIKDRIPWKERIDPEFYRAAIRKNIATYAAIQGQRIPAFFASGFPRFNAEDIGIPDSVYRLYLQAYSRLYRFEIANQKIPVSLLILICGVVWARSRAEIRRQYIVGGALVAYFAVLITALSYQDGHFMRMRTECEPILLYLILLPIARILERLVAGVKATVRNGIFE